MNKEEYLRELEIHLKKYLTRAEVDDILRDYGEYFEDGRRQNKTDIEISAKLGEPSVIALQFTEENIHDKKEKRNLELEKMKEAASNTVNIAKEKMKGVHPIQNISKTVETTTRKTKGPIRGLLSFFCKVIGIVIGLFFGGILAFLFLCMFGCALLLTLSVLFSGICGLFASLATLSFISVFFTLGGILASVSLICVGLLLGIFLYVMLKKIYDLMKYGLECFSKSL